MHDQKTLSLAAGLRRGLRGEFPAVARLSVTDPDFMEAILDYAARSQSNEVRATALTLLSRLANGTVPDAPATPAAGEHRPGTGGTRRRVYRGRVIEGDD